MIAYRLILVLNVILLLSACGPGAVIGAVGNVINRSIQDQQEQQVADQAARPVPGANNPATYNNPTQQDYDRQAIADANLNLGIAYMQKGEYRAALDKFTRARIAKPDYSPTYNALGVFYERIGKPEKAEENFRESLELDANNFDTLNNYASFLCRNDRYDEAQKIYLSAAENRLNNKPAIALGNAGQCAVNHGHVDAGENYLRQALEKNPKLPLALMQMADISYAQGDYLGARGYLQRYLAVANHTPRSLWLGIQVEQQLGDKNTVSSYALLLRNKYADSQEAQLLRESGIN